jgi:UDPglucose--hexose-1-phosphate uridylyltransferase
VRVVPNKFPALRVEGTLDRQGAGMYDRMQGIGAHEIIIEGPAHDKDIPDLSVHQIYLVLRAWRDRVADLMRDPRFRYILIFKNFGETAGATLDHPHSQLIAMPVTPRSVAVQLDAARQHYHLKERCIYCDVMRQEVEERKRIVSIDEHFVTWCPYASRFPFETWMAPRHHSHDFALSSDELLRYMAVNLRDALWRMNRALGNPPYNLVMHSAPNTLHRPVRARYWETLSADFHWHIEIFPRLTRTAGFEWGSGMYINPTPPEDAAGYLREIVSDEGRR